MAEVDKNQLVSRAFWHSAGGSGTRNFNNEGSDHASKRYLVYMEVPKIKIGDYRKSSCVVGNILRFHFLMKIAQNEDQPLRLLPIKAYNVPVVNVAVIHRPLMEDDSAKGPIPKSPDARSPLMKYESKERVATEDNLEENFRKGSAVEERRQKQKEESKRQGSGRKMRESGWKEYESYAQVSDDRHDGGKHKHGRKKRKKYFVYCEVPKVAIGSYRISSVTSSDLIHCHFIVKIAQDEVNGQPVLRPIKKYHRPRANFAVIHRSLIVDDEYVGPIPRSPGVKSSIIRGRENLYGEDELEVLHATMGFHYGEETNRTKYELVTQWSLVADNAGRIAPELVLSKASG